MKKELWLRAFSKDESEKINERVLELSDEHCGELRVIIYRDDLKGMARIAATLDDDAVKILMDELGEENVKVVEKEEYESPYPPAKRKSLARIADALESIAHSLQSLDESGIRTFPNN